MTTTEKGATNAAPRPQSTSDLGEIFARQRAAFTHLRPVMYQRPIFGHTGGQMIYPPYGKIADTIVKLMRRI